MVTASLEIRYDRWLTDHEAALPVGMRWAAGQPPLAHWQHSVR
ncbi:hypothetical protein [Phytohabitans aurantiacus]|nr:hypothetical protein [Phytohabitans aurantiacus]